MLNLKLIKMKQFFNTYMNGCNSNSSRMIKLFLVCMITITSIKLHSQNLENINGSMTGFIEIQYGILEHTVNVQMLAGGSETSMFNREGTFTAYYALDSNGNPETFFSSSYVINNPRSDQSYLASEYTVLPGVKRIMPNALDVVKTKHLPKSIRFLPVNFNFSLTDFYEEDSETSNILSQAKKKEIKQEVARYNIQGVMVDNQYSGVQIIKHDDGSSIKVLHR